MEKKEEKMEKNCDKMEKRRGMNGKIQICAPTQAGYLICSIPLFDSFHKSGQSIRAGVENGI